MLLVAAFLAGRRDWPGRASWCPGPRGGVAGSAGYRANRGQQVSGDRRRAGGRRQAGVDRFARRRGRAQAAVPAPADGRLPRRPGNPADPLSGLPHGQDGLDDPLVVGRLPGMMLTSPQETARSSWYSRTPSPTSTNRASPLADCAAARCIQLSVSSVTQVARIRITSASCSRAGVTGVMPYRGAWSQLEMPQVSLSARSMDL
jgi:hypothetical protein